MDVLQGGVSIQVHFIRSVQRVAKKVNPRDSSGRDAFIAIGQKILKAESAKQIMILFEVLKGERPLCDTIALMPHDDKLTECCPINEKEWQRAATWVEWWIRRRHLRKFHRFCLTL